MTPELRERARAVRLLVLDADGVLTNGLLYYGDDGVEVKPFHIQDGLGLRMLMASGIQVAIITGRSSRAVQARAEDLGITHVYQRASDKLAVFEQVLSRLALNGACAAAMGDDLPDLPVLRRCRFAACVPEAPAVVRRHAHYVTQRQGGGGAVREVCELLLLAQGMLEARLQEYLR